MTNEDLAYQIAKKHYRSARQITDSQKECYDSACPFGKIYCDGCNHLGTGGCYYNATTSYTITKDKQKSLYDGKFNELMQLSKETLVELILGKRPI